MNGFGRAQAIRNLLAERCGVIEVMAFLRVPYSELRREVLNPPSLAPRAPKAVCLRGHRRPERGSCPICHAAQNRESQRARRAAAKAAKS